MTDQFSDDSQEAMIHKNLSEWFALGHTRFTLVLAGEKTGRVLLAEPSENESCGIRLTERWTVVDSQSRILERGEEQVSLASFCHSQENSSLLLAAAQNRLAGGPTPPPVVPNHRAPKP